VPDKNRCPACGGDGINQGCPECPPAPVESPVSPVQFVNVQRGEDVIVRGRRVPLLEATLPAGGEVFLVFDRRFGISLDAGNYADVVSFVADVIEQCLDPRVGRHFPIVHEITAVDDHE
jgi:hypothetical protein